MSRSIKHTPVCKDNGIGKDAKRYASKSVRRLEDTPSNGSAYKRVYNSYDIHDYVSRWTREEAVKAWAEEDADGRFHKMYDTLEEFLEKCWAKAYQRK